MLRRLEVERLAILDGLALEFGPGLNVLSGETGAGKSLLLDALQLALGVRGDPALIRQGEQALRVSALFELGEGAPVLGPLGSLGLEPEDGELLLVREVARQGRSTCRVNGRLVTASLLREVGALLLAVAGQGEHHRFAQAAARCAYLDAYAGAADRRERVRRAHAAWRQARDARRGAGGDPRERARRCDALSFAVGEIDAARLEPGEEGRLEARRRVLANGQRLLEAARAGLEGLWEGEAAVRERLGAVEGELRSAAHLDPELEPVRALVEQASVSADEAARALRRYAEGLQFDPAEVAAVEERWSLLQRLQRKYGDSVAEVIAHRERAAAELADLEAGSERAARLAAEADTRAAALAEACADLSRARSEAAARLGAEVGSELRELGMAGARLDVQLGQRQDPDGVPAGGLRLAAGEAGWDEVRFLWAANPGEPAQPLERAASGGELARLLLALHALRAESTLVPTLVFDEVDAGVGGRAARAVATRLQRLGAVRQVLCVTHLAIIAAAADRHFAIEKRAGGGRTATGVRELGGEQRTGEIARMLDGGRGSTARAHALELLRQLARPAG